MTKRQIEIYLWMRELLRTIGDRQKLNSLTYAQLEFMCSRGVFLIDSELSKGTVPAEKPATEGDFVSWMEKLSNL